MLFPDPEAAILSVLLPLYEAMFQALPISTRRRLATTWQAESATLAERMLDTKNAADLAGIFQTCLA